MIAISSARTRVKNAHVKANMLAVMLVAIHKAFGRQTQPRLSSWPRVCPTGRRQWLARQRSHRSRSTDAALVATTLKPDDWQALQQVIETARPISKATAEVHRITELNLDTISDPTNQPSRLNDSSQDPTPNHGQEQEDGTYHVWLQWVVGLCVLLMLGLGFYRALRQARQPDQTT